MNRVRLAAAACALLLPTACTAGPYSDAAQQLDPLTPPSASVTVAEPSPRLTTRQMLGNDLVVTVSPPRSFTPTAAARPRVPRAVAFELVIDNEGTTPYRPSGLSITASCNGASAVQVVDSTQGYTGFVGATEEVQPGRSVQVVVAFAVPVQRTDLRLMVQGDAKDGSRATVFAGIV